MSKNYELIYKLRKYNTSDLRNLEIQFENKARAEAQAIHKKYTDAIEKELGHANFEVTSEMCMADGILGHVYTWEGEIKPKEGIGKKKCIYCGLDDFDF